MARVQQSIDIRVPVHALYGELVHFENYPHFMQDVQSVEQRDDRHWHWTTRMANRSVEWDAEITEQEEGRCIAWRSVSGPSNAGRVELMEAGPQASRVTIMLESEPEQVPGSMVGFHENELEQRLKMDLARCKEYVESRGAMHTDDAAQPTQAATSGAPGAGYAAGSEGWSGDEDGDALVAASRRAAARAPEQNAAAQSALSPEADRTTQSDYSLSQSAGEADDGRFSVAEEVSFDQQSDAARRIGQMPDDANAAAAANAVGEAARGPQQSEPGKADIRQSLDRAVPPSE